MMKDLLTIWIFFTLIINIHAKEQGTFTDVRDGQVYKWVKIKNQTWMAENLAYLPQVNRVSEAKFEGIIYYVYGYDGNDVSMAKAEENYKKYGVLYNQDAARESCPAGWHLPSDEEWMDLEKYLGLNPDEEQRLNPDEAINRVWRRSENVGQKLKSNSGWEEKGGTDEIGFNALPGGLRGQAFFSIGYCAYFWTATPAEPDNGFRRMFCGSDNGSHREEERKYVGLSVRCVKD